MKDNKITIEKIKAEIRKRMKIVEEKRDYFDGGKHTALFSLLKWIEGN